MGRKWVLIRNHSETDYLVSHQQGFTILIRNLSGGILGALVYISWQKSALFFKIKHFAVIVRFCLTLAFTEGKPYSSGDPLQEGFSYRSYCVATCICPLTINSLHNWQQLFFCKLNLFEKVTYRMVSPET